VAGSHRIDGAWVWASRALRRQVAVSLTAPLLPLASVRTADDRRVSRMSSCRRCARVRSWRIAVADSRRGDWWPTTLLRRSERPLSA
jgi:hypothetical protein